jgi:hypothetical protein
VPVATLPEKVLSIEEGFVRHGVPHAFGGALALAYYATPRATIDIDVNVFVSLQRAGEPLRLLEALGATPLPAAERARLQRDGQARMRWDATPIDLFFAYDAFHDSCLQRRRRLPFGDGDSIHVLSAEDLTLFKAIFDREKDWRDIDELVFALGDELDEAYLRDWLARIVGRDDPRFRRLERALG